MFAVAADSGIIKLYDVNQFDKGPFDTFVVSSWLCCVFRGVCSVDVPLCQQHLQPALWHANMVGPSGLLMADQGDSIGTGQLFTWPFSPLAW